MDSDFPDRINIEELFEGQHNSEIQRHSIYLKILNKVHKKITTTSKTRNSNNFCFFIIPEILLGVPMYNLEDCKQYIFKNLIDNGFQIKYTHPNLLFISLVKQTPFLQFRLYNLMLIPSALISLLKNLILIFIDSSGSASEYQSVIINPPE